MTTSGQAYAVMCGVLCIYPLIVAFVAVQLYRAFMGGAFRRRIK